jgi:hypothetical protein
MIDKVKVGLDVHGVIDTDPHFFAHLSYMLRAEGHEVHIVTGREICDELLDKLKENDVGYTQIFSITSYHKQIGTQIAYKRDDLTQPVIDDSKWNRSKADYAEREGLHFHIDDLPVYGQYFTGDTQFLLYTPQLRAFLFQLTGWSDKFAQQLDSLLRASTHTKGAVNL